MSGETPKIDFEALRARLQQGVDRSIVAADAGRKSQSPEGVLLASSDKPRGRTRGAHKENGNDTDTEKIRTHWIKKTEQAIAEAKSLEGLMKLVDSVKSKSGEAKLSFSLPTGLPTLLKNDKDFSKRFNGIFDEWSNRVVEVLFDENGASHFRDFLHESMKKDRNIRMGRFFSMYLDSRNLGSLDGVGAVIRRMKELWKEHLPIVRQKSMEKKNPPEEIIVGSVYILKSDSSQEYTVTEISGDGDITYMPVAGGATVHSSREKFLEYLRSKRVQSKGVKSSAVNKGGLRPIDPDDAVHDFNNRDTGIPEGYKGAIPHPAVEAVKITQENLAKSSERTYDELFKEADDGPYHGILLGAVAAGFLTMKEGAQKESVDLKAYDKDHPGEILEALIDGMKESFHRVGKKLGWSELETDIYARGLVQKSIEKYLK